MTALGDAANKALVSYLKEKIDALPIKPEIKNLAEFILENSDAYATFFIHYAAKHKGNIDPDELLTALLLEKGKALTSFGIKVIDRETASNVWAIVNLIIDLRQDMKYAEIPIPYLNWLVVAVCMEQSGFEFLNNSTWSQIWWYEHVLKGNSSYTLPPPIKASVLKKFRRGRRAGRPA